jgi:SNF2 family DNA or RNA helicase
MRCPTCREPLRKNDIYVVKSNTEHEEDELYKIVGSKISKLITIIREILQDPTNYIILFAEWEDVLCKVRSTLLKYKIPVVICKGNKATRESAIYKFNYEDNYRIIALSSQYASQGTNLTKANKIIFINPVSGNKEQRKEIEAQAIARSFRLGQYRDLEIFRFVVKDTIEEVIYKENNEIVIE